MKKQKKDREISKQPFGSDPLNLTQKSGLFDYDDRPHKRERSENNTAKGGWQQKEGVMMAWSSLIASCCYQICSHSLAPRSPLSGSAPLCLLLRTYFFRFTTSSCVLWIVSGVD